MVDVNENLLKYLNLWNLSQPKLLATTPTSFVYEVSGDEDLILKIFTPSGAIDEKASSAILTAWNGNGAVALKQFDEGALLIERLENPNLYFFSELNQENQATEIFIDIVKKIHSIPIPQTHSIPELAVLFKPLVSFKNFPADQKALFQKATQIGQMLLATQENVVLLHGDLHHENVMRRQNGEYVCFDPKGFIGDPCYEIATILKNPWSFPEISEREDLCLERAKTFSAALGLSLSRIVDFAFVHMCLSIMWAIQDGRDSSHQFKIARFLEHHVSK